MLSPKQKHTQVKGMTYSVLHHTLSRGNWEITTLSIAHPDYPRCFRNTFWAVWIRTNFYIMLVTHCSDILLLSPFKFHCCKEDWLAQFHQVFPLQKPATISTEQTRKLWPCSRSKPNSLAPESKVFIVLCCPNLKGIVLGLDGETILFESKTRWKASVFPPSPVFWGVPYWWNVGTCP